MKIIKYLLLLVLVVVIGLVAYTAMQPDDYDIHRSRLIKAPAKVIFNNVNEYKNWMEWGPWLEQDSTIKATYPEVTSGVGGSYSWTSANGPGSIKTVALNEYTVIDQKMVFNEDPEIDVYWKFDETDEGTNVTWGMKCDTTPFIFKFFAALSGGMDGMMGPMYEKGLENLDKVIMEEMEKNPPQPEVSNEYKIGEVTVKEMTAKKFIGYHQQTKIDHETMHKLFMEYMPKAGMHAAQNNLEFGDYTPGAIYTKWDEEKGEAEFYIGLLLNKELTPAEGMTVIDLPTGKAATISKFGNYGTGDMEAHKALDTYVKANNLTPKGPALELYVNDPEKLKPIEIQTDIYYPIQ